MNVLNNILVIVVSIIIFLAFVMMFGTTLFFALIIGALCLAIMGSLAWVLPILVIIIIIGLIF